MENSDFVIVKYVFFMFFSKTTHLLFLFSKKPFWEEILEDFIVTMGFFLSIINIYMKVMKKDCKGHNFKNKITWHFFCPIKKGGKRIHFVAFMKVKNWKFFFKLLKDVFWIVHGLLFWHSNQNLFYFFLLLA